MTRPKKWYLQLADKGTDSQNPSDVGACQNVVLVNSEGLMKKPNAREPLGNVENVCRSDASKYSEDYVMFRCENGRILLSTKAYESAKSVIKGKYSSVDGFITAVNSFIKGTVQPSDLPTPLNLPPIQCQNRSVPLEPDSLTAPLQLQAQLQMQTSELVNPPTLSPATQPPMQTQPSPSHLPPQIQFQPSEVNPSTLSPGMQSHIQTQPSTTLSPATQFQVQQSSSPLQRPSISTKRGKSLDSNQQSLPKRLKYINDGIDEEIERHRKGLFEVPVSQLLVPPRESRLLREPDNISVEKLKEKMVLDPSAPGATPMAVLCKDVSTDQFNEKFLNVYKYEVLGGLHTLIAKNKLMEEYPENPFFQQALAEIYVGLSDEQALRLAQRHNLNSHFIHKITHRNLVEACRARLYRIANKEMDSETPNATSEWKDSCKRAIIPKGTPSTHQDAIFHQASLPKPVWDVASEVMDLFETFKLKGQKAQCGLKISKPEFKQQSLAPLRRLSLNDQCSLLLRCKNKEISLAEMKQEADVLKRLETLKKTFVKLTNAKSWEDAETQFQPFASVNELKKFSSLDLTKEVPPSFVNFCRRAKASKESESFHIEDQITKHKELIACTIQGKLCELSGHVIMSAYPDFHGADMILLSIPEGSSKQDVESTGYTAKEINCTASLYTYTTVAICHPNQLYDVQTVWSQLFDNVDMMFLISKDFHKPGEEKKLDSFVLVAVLGFESVGGTITNNQFIYCAEEPKPNYIEGSREDISKYLMEHFCSPSGTILDISNDSRGTMSLVALENGRNVIGIVENEDYHSAIFQKLQAKYVTE